MSRREGEWGGKEGGGIKREREEGKERERVLKTGRREAQFPSRVIEITKKGERMNQNLRN